MNKCKVILPVVLVVLLGFLPLFTFLGVFCFTPPQYSQTFYGALNEKHDRLQSTETPKIVVVGGSSVAFGLDSQMIAEKTGYEVVNFGLYADLGTKMMLDLSRKHINEGDIVIIAPEMDEQTLSLYFNGSSALKATDDNPSMLFELDGDDWYDIWGAVWGFVGEKWSYFKNGSPNPEGVYNAGNFNEYGDISPEKFPRTENIMGLGYDPAKALYLSQDIFSQDFVDYLNDYIDGLTKKGATVYYSFCPMNEMAVEIDPNSPFSKEMQISDLSDALLTYLEETLHCPVLGTPEEEVMPSLYFYDSNFHLNDRGVPIHTARLIDNLLAKEERSPVHAGESVKTQTGYTWNDQFFVYQREADGTCAIVGTTQLAQNLKTLYVPAEADGVTVSRIANEAFLDCRALSALLFASGGNLTTVEQDAFANMLSLNLFYFYGAPPTYFPTSDQLGDSNALVYVPKELLSTYQNAPAFADYTRINAMSVYITEEVMLAECLAEVENVKNNGMAQTENEYFIFTLLPSGTWEITGLTTLGKATATLVVPDTVKNDAGEDIPVTSVGDYALRGATEARALVIPSGSLISQFGRFVFAESSVDGLYMFVDCTNITTTVSKEMVVGAPASFKIYIDDAERLDAYRTDYGWSTFTSDGCYQASTISEEELVSGNASPSPAPQAEPMTKLVIVLAVIAAAVGFGTLAYHAVRHIMTKQATAKDKETEEDEV